MFESTGPHFCPVCPPVTGKLGHQLGQRLSLVQSNYSGTGVDIAACEQCCRNFIVSYQVKEILEIKPDSVLRAKSGARPKVKSQVKSKSKSEAPPRKI